MSDFPIQVQRISLTQPSSSGGKDYHILQIVTATRKAVVIFRWGRKGSWGQMEVNTFDETSLHRAEAMINSKLRAKEGGGYTLYRDERNSYSDAEAFTAGMSQWLLNMKPDEVSFISKELSTIGAKAKAAPDAPPKMVVETPPPEPTVEDRLAKNPNWGAWA